MPKIKDRAATENDLEDRIRRALDQRDREGTAHYGNLLSYTRFLRPCSGTRPPTRLTVRPTVRPAVRPSNRSLSARSAGRLSAQPSACPSVRPSACPSARPSACPSVRPSACSLAPRPAACPSISPAPARVLACARRPSACSCCRLVPVPVPHGSFEHLGPGRLLTVPLQLRPPLHTAQWKVLWLWLPSEKPAP